MILALDIGTSSTRALLFDCNGQTIGTSTQIEYSQTTTPDGGVECNAQQLFELTATCIDNILAANPNVAIEAVATSCFWHSLVAVDENANAVTPLYSWADNRSVPYVAALKSLLDEDESHARLGCVFHTSYWPAKLLWLQHAHAALFTSTRSIRWMGFGEYFQLQICGEFKMSLSVASGTGIFQQNTCDWDNEILSVLPVTREQLPILIDCSEPLGNMTDAYRKRWPRLAQAKWFPAVGDGACSNIGSGCTDASRVALNIGTSGALRVVLHEYSLPALRGLWRYRIDRRRVLMGGAVSNAGNIWAWCRQNFALTPDIEEQMSRMRPDEHGLTVLPFLAGERSPLWNADARFVLAGAGLDTTPVHIARACLEASSFRFAAVYELLQEALKATSSTQSVEVIASGGALSKSRVWSQITADCLGAPLRHSSESEASARGAALLALESLGVINLSELPVRNATCVEADADNHALYRRALKRQETLYEKLYG